MSKVYLCAWAKSMEAVACRYVGYPTLLRSFAHEVERYSHKHGSTLLNIAYTTWALTELEIPSPKRWKPVGNPSISFDDFIKDANRRMANTAVASGWQLNMRLLIEEYRIWLVADAFSKSLADTHEKLGDFDDSLFLSQAADIAADFSKVSYAQRSRV